MSHQVFVATCGKVHVVILDAGAASSPLKRVAPMKLLERFSRRGEPVINSNAHSYILKPVRTNTRFSVGHIKLYPRLFTQQCVNYISARYYKCHIRWLEFR